MRWVLVSEAQGATANSVVLLDSDKLKHLRKVLRMEWDEEVRVSDGRGRLFEGWLEKKGDTGAVRLGKILASEKVPREVELVVCLPKNVTMDWLVEKAVECGVTTIQPVVSSRSVVRVDPNETDKYVRRWQTIMDGAVEQSERLWRPLVKKPIPWRQWIIEKSDCQSFAFVSETRATAQTKETWKKLCAVSENPVRAVIGPEGGFTDQERTELESAGFELVTLGKLVLRVETAVISALTLLRVSREVSIT